MVGIRMKAVRNITEYIGIKTEEDRAFDRAVYFTSSSNLS